tara:strand:+ start:316 stop:849 length:534 start_codon:yes stop_codon:yes gene_type:complete
MKMETEYQSLLASRVRDIGFFARKIPPDFNKGMPDMFISHADFGPMFIEIKRVLPSNTSYWKKDVGLTGLQVRTINSMRAAGTRAFVGVFVPWNHDFEFVILNDADDWVRFDYGQYNGVSTDRFTREFFVHLVGSRGAGPQAPISVPTEAHGAGTTYTPATIAAPTPLTLSRTTRTK